MGIILYDQSTGEKIFDTNFWHWRTIVEAVRFLHVLPKERTDSLHTPSVGALSKEEARIVGAALLEKLIPTVSGEERILIDGRRTRDPDDGTFYRDPIDQHKNYSTNREMLEEFSACCLKCSGFRVA